MGLDGSDCVINRSVVVGNTRLFVGERASRLDGAKTASGSRSSRISIEFRKCEVAGGV